MSMEPGKNEDSERDGWTTFMTNCVDLGFSQPDAEGLSVTKVIGELLCTTQRVSSWRLHCLH